MLFLNNQILKYVLFVFSITLIGGILFIFPDFIYYPTIGLKGVIYTILHWALNCIPLLLLIYAISLNKYLFSISFPLLVLLGTTIGFYSFFYRATLTPMIIDATLNNDLGTSIDVISWPQVLITLLIFAVSVTIVIYRFKYIKVTKKTYHLFSIIILSIIAFSINDRARTSFFQHFPTSFYYNFNEYRRLNENRELPRINPDPQLNYKSNEEITVVFVIGESLRADHLSLNGYPRNTTPLLSKQQNIVSFKNIYSQYTYTNPRLHIYLLVPTA
jgi:glucan phosphoethanolaminetransferase (alkaline phosphatase superfamily)